MATEKRLIDAEPIKKFIVDGLNNPDLKKAFGHDAIEILAEIEYAPTVDAIILPCEVGDTVYGHLHGYGKEIHECKVTRIKACQFKDGSLRYFLDVEFDIIDPYHKDGRLMRCGSQAVFGEDYGNWNRVYLTKKEAKLAKKDGDLDGNL